MTTKTFIDRPLLSAVISIFIIALGVIALLTLPLVFLPKNSNPDNLESSPLKAPAQRLTKISLAIISTTTSALKY